VKGIKIPTRSHSDLPFVVLEQIAISAKCTRYVDEVACCAGIIAIQQGQGSDGFMIEREIDTGVSQTNEPGRVSAQFAH
jgi:hypothetical protein